MVPTVYGRAPRGLESAEADRAARRVRAARGKRLFDRRTDRAARVAPPRQVAAQSAHRRIAVETAQLAGALARELFGPGQLVAAVDELERVLDRRRGEHAPGELGGDRRAPEPLAFLQRRDERLRERGVVD